MSSVFSGQFGRYLRSQLDAAKWEDIGDDSWVVTPDDIKGYEAWLPSSAADAAVSDDDYTMHTFANVDRIDDNAVRLTNDDVTGESNDERIKRLVARMMSRDDDVLRESSPRACYLIAPAHPYRVADPDRALQENMYEYRLSSFIPYQFIAPSYCGKIIFGRDDDLQIYPIAPTPTVPPVQGATCTRCNLHNEYAPPSASYICYECR